MRHPTLTRYPAPDWGRLLRTATLAAAGGATVLTLVLCAAGIDRPSANPHRGVVSSTVKAARTQAASPPIANGAGAVDAGPFVGIWHVHTILLVISPNGTGTASWPTHNWCDTKASELRTACDQLVPVDGGEQIVDGGHAQIHLTDVAGARAAANVEGSTDPSLLPDGHITLTMAPDDVVTVSSAVGQVALCGPQAASLTVQQQDAEGINCGA